MQARLRHRCRAPLVVGLCLLIATVPLPLQAAVEEDADAEEPEAASEPEEPPARSTYFLLPIEVDSDSGATNGDALISRILPANSIPIGKKWRLLNLGIVTIADAPGGRPGSPGNPSSLPGPPVFGLGDLTDAVLFSPQSAKWSLGAIFGIPTATDDALGSGKWTAGPAFRVFHQTGPWRLSLLGANLRSFAGDSQRADVHQLLVRGLVRRRIKEKWFFLYSPIITANWNASSNQRWLVPLGGGFGRAFVLRRPVNISLQYYSNVVRPDGAPSSVVRLGFTMPFNLPGRSS